MIRNIWNRIFFKQLFGALVCIGLAWPVFAAEPARGIEEVLINGKPIPDVVATVNGIDLPAQLLKSEMYVFQTMRKQQGKEASDKDKSDFAQKVLGDLIDKELMYQKGRKMNILIPAETMEKELDNIREKFPNQEAFLAALAFQKLNLDSLKSKIEKELTEEEIIRREIAPKAKVEDKKVQDFYEKHKKEFVKPELFEVSHIFVSVPNPKSEGKAASPEDQKKADKLVALMEESSRESIQKVQSEIKAGKDFAELAKKFSEDNASSEQGGSLGEVTPDSLPEQMSAVIKKLKVGEVSDVVRTDFGLHIIKLTGKSAARPLELKEVKSDIMNHLLREAVRDLRKTYIEQLKKSSNIKINL